ncbi:hypothetical protein [Nostoc sp.]
MRILDFRFWIKELKFNPKSSIPSPKGRRARDGLVQSLMGETTPDAARVARRTPVASSRETRPRRWLPNVLAPLFPRCFTKIQY